MGHKYGYRKKQEGKNTNRNICDLLSLKIVHSESNTKSCAVEKYQ